MKIELLAIGDEVLAGKTVNTNGAYLASRFWEEGVLVSYHQVVPDDPSVIEKVLAQIFARSDFVITVGGLGPTKDDRTREVIAKFFETELVFHQEVYDRLIKRFSKGKKGVENQAMQPKGSRLFYNDVGTAPGVWLEKGGKTLVMLPGVPSEMKALWEEQVFEEVLKKVDGNHREGRRFLSVCTIPEIVVDETTDSLLKEFPDVRYGIYPDLGLVQLVLKSQNQKSLENAQNKLAQEFGPKVFSKDVKGTIEGSVHEKLIQEGKTLSLAESCTGGAIASRITSQSGSSNYFLGGVVSYSNQAKHSLLGVEESTLKKHGAVSEETAKEMVLGALDAFDSDYALSITGIAGPDGGTEEKPVGLVYGGVGKKGEEPLIWKLHMKTSRLSVIRATVNYALSKLWLKLNES